MIKPSLSNVYLHWMYEKAEDKKAPMQEIKQFKASAPARFCVPPELLSLFNADHTIATDEEKFRSEYVSDSAPDWEDTDLIGWTVNRSVLWGDRVVYYNKPSKAVTPEHKAESEKNDEMDYVAP